jgi:hypothetical protein
MLITYSFADNASVTAPAKASQAPRRVLDIPTNFYVCFAAQLHLHLREGGPFIQLHRAQEV